MPATPIPLDVKNEIIQFYINHYHDANFTKMFEIGREDLGYCISDTISIAWLREQMILSPKARKHTKKKFKVDLQKKLKKSTSVKIQNSIKEAITFIDENNAHPRRSRCKYFGEMIQMDASSYQWINNHLWHLHLAVDDTTGEVVGAYFDTQETLKGYYNVLYQILKNYGIPACFYTDKRTVFEYKKKNCCFDDEDKFTQFSYACHTLV